MLARARSTALALLAAVAIGACGDGGESSPGETTAVATTSHVGDLVRNVGGERLSVRQLLGASADPHGYEPRPSDARAVAEAEIVFRSGGELDEWLSDLIDNAGGDARVVELLESVETRTEKPGGEPDPHWWQDPRNAEMAVVAIRDALVEADPGGRDVYARNATGYLQRIRRLDRSIAACLRKVPVRQRKLVTTHDALGYYARRYGIDVVGALIPALSTQAQPSAGETARLVRQIEREDVRAIFPERALDPRLERAVARETGAEVGDALWADTLGPKGSGGATYLEAMASNTGSIVEGLSGGGVSCLPRG